ncbi:MAG: hypothetical protein HC871_16865, partial [Rhizobiales bacterium]|nr:hypothetical protein [Hyphomicrobiales bacterium]
MVLVDTPGFADPNRDPADTLAAARVRRAIWCTRAQQAWRHSEHVIWSNLPSHLRETGLLVVTRSDKLDRASDRRSVMARLRQEAGALFHEIVLLSTLKAQQAQGKHPGELDVALWKRSGGEALASGLLQSLSRAVRRVLPANADQADQPSDERPSSSLGIDHVVRPLAVVAAPEQEENEDGVDASPEELDPAVPEEAEEDPEPTVIEREIVVDGESDIDVLLSDLVRAIDGCRLAACIDLDQTRALAVARDLAARPVAIGEQIAALASSLLAGPATEPIRDAIAASDAAGPAAPAHRQRHHRPPA